MKNQDATLKRSIKKLTRLQKQELSALKMYRELANKFDDPHLKETFLALAASEGKHASICKTRTQLVVRPGGAMKNAVMFMLKLCGKKLTFRTIARFERLGARLYGKIEGIFPEVNSIVADELDHFATMRELATYKPAEQTD